MTKKVLLLALCFGLVVFHSVRIQSVAAEPQQGRQSDLEATQKRSVARSVAHSGDHRADLARTGLVPYCIQPPDILLITTSSEAADNGSSGFSGGEHLVRPDGTINLGHLGTVSVSGKTIEEVNRAVNAKLAEHKDPRTATVDVLMYNSKFFYIITEGNPYDHVVRVLCTGNETVIDAIAQLGGLEQTLRKQVWVSRPGANQAADEILPVDLKALMKGDGSATNYQLLPGDRVFVSDQPAKDRGNDQVRLHIRIIRDSEGNLEEFEALKNGPMMQGETKQILATLRILSRNHLIEMVASPVITCTSGISAHLAIEGTSFEQSEGVDKLTIDATPNVRDDSTVMLTTEIQLRSSRGKLGVDFKSSLINEGTTVIMRAHPPRPEQQRAPADAIYVVLTPELVK